MATKDEALIEEARDVANEIDVAIAFKREWEAINIIPSLLRKLAEALEQPSNMVAVPADQLEKMQKELKQLRAEHKKWQGFARRLNHD